MSTGLTEGRGLPGVERRRSEWKGWFGTGGTRVSGVHRDAQLGDFSDCVQRRRGEGLGEENRVTDKARIISRPLRHS